jgi:hypothetical protein
MNQGTKLVLLMKKNRSKKSRASVPLRDAHKYGCTHGRAEPRPNVHQLSWLHTVHTYFTVLHFLPNKKMSNVLFILNYKIDIFIFFYCTDFMRTKQKHFF